MSYDLLSAQKNTCARRPAQLRADGAVARVWPLATRRDTYACVLRRPLSRCRTIRSIDRYSVGTVATSLAIKRPRAEDQFDPETNSRLSADIFHGPTVSGSYTNIYMYKTNWAPKIRGPCAGRTHGTTVRPGLNLPW